MSEENRRICGAVALIADHIAYNKISPDNFHNISAVLVITDHWQKYSIGCHSRPKTISPNNEKTRAFIWYPAFIGDPAFILDLAFNRSFMVCMFSTCCCCYSIIYTPELLYTCTMFVHLWDVKLNVLLRTTLNLGVNFLNSSFHVDDGLLRYTANRTYNRTWSVSSVATYASSPAATY